MKYLNWLRNGFIHFLPKTFALEVSDLPDLADDCLGIIEFLAFESKNVHWLDESLGDKARALVSELKELIDSVRAAYGG